MLSVDEALQLVLQTVKPIAPRAVPLAEALGCKLAEDVASDVDSPPHDKSVVDGYAIQFDDLVQGKGTFRFVEEVTAGRVPQQIVQSGTTTRIMTGAPLPDGADTVVMVERSTIDGDRVTLDDDRAKRGQHIVRRGSSMRRGDVVLDAGNAPLTPSQIGLLAEVGRATVRVVPRPRIAVLATGDELVEPSQIPGPGQIRNSNGPMLAAFLTERRSQPVDLGITRDVRDDLRNKISAGLQTDGLILSGGVSAGVLDLVPSVLAELGVKQVFHKVHLKPGKPLWFGTFTGDDGAVKPVFGLPGNPVSSLICFELFVRPALAKMRAAADGDAPIERTVSLAKPFMHRGDRPTYWPGRLADDGRGQALVWQGSGDLQAIAGADCVICFPEGDRQYETGDSVTIRLL